MSSRNSGGSLTDTDHYMYQFRLIIIGESTVGKSCLLRRFTQGRWSEHSDPTVGVDFHTKVVQIDGHNLKLQLWDTAGQERFRAITRSYFRNAVGALLVFDIADHTSFSRVSGWMEDVQASSKPHVPIFVLVGNKVDMERHRQVLRADAERFASSRNIDYIETSSRTGVNVEEAYNLLARRVFEAIQDGTIVIGEGWDGVKKGDESPKDFGRVKLGQRNKIRSEVTTTEREGGGGGGGKCCGGN